LQSKEQEEVLAIVNECLLLIGEDEFLEVTEDSTPIAEAMIAADNRPLKWFVATYQRDLESRWFVSSLKWSILTFCEATISFLKGH
jgi:hypothetical protein